MTFKRFLVTITAAALIAAQTMTAAAEVMEITLAETSVPSEINSYIQLKKLNDADEGMASYVWTDENGDVINNEMSDISLFAEDDLPKRYSSLDEGYITAVRNQGPDGCCWAFASIAAVEANMVKKGYAKNPDYSEEHLAYFASNSLSEKYGDGRTSQNPYSDGGNSRDSATLLSAWGGAELEENFPYSDGRPLNERIYDEKDRYNSYAHLENYIEYDHSQINAAKQAIMDYGSVTYEYYSSAPTDDERYYYNSDESHRIDHEVLIVGWDDDLDKNLFTETPQNNGAWLAKNSWGDNWGDNGYFWISYENAVAYGKIGVFDMEKADRHDNIYLYDGDGISMYLSNIPSYANTYTAQQDEAVRAAAGFVYSECVVTAAVYKCAGDKIDKYSPLAVKSAAVPGNGYFTIEFDTPVNVKAGEKFSIVISSSDKYAPIEAETEDAIYTSNEGESYMLTQDNYGRYRWYGVEELAVSGAVAHNVSARALTTNGLVETEFEINALRELINKANCLDKSDYDAAAWERVQTALNKAEVLCNSMNEIRNVIIDENTRELKTALESLHSGIYTKQHLDVVINGVEDYNKDAYTETSWAELRGALDAAKAVPDNAFDYEIDCAIQRLLNAEFNLKKAMYITNAEELQALFQKELPDDTEAVLKNDIIFDVSVENNFVPIENFKGTFDGNGHVISGLNINGDDYRVGLFAEIPEGSVVRNVGVVNSKLCSLYLERGCVGGIAGVCSGELYNSYVIPDAESVYGIVGIVVAGGKVVNCYADKSSEDVIPFNISSTDITIDNVYCYDKENERVEYLDLELLSFTSEDGYTGEYLAEKFNRTRGENKAWFADENGYPAMRAGGGMYIKDGTLMSYSGNDAVITVPAEVERIAEGAFENNVSLAKIKFAGDAPEVEKRAFENCGAILLYGEGAKGYNIAPWTYLKCREDADIQYTVSVSVNADGGYNVQISPLVKWTDNANVIMAQYSADGRFESLKRMPLSEAEFSKTDGAYILHANDKCALMLWNEMSVPLAAKTEIK